MTVGEGRMDAPALRRLLAAFLGAERFRKFVQRLRVSDRLRYWQEEAWAGFIAAHPEFAVGTDELRAALRVCWLHGAELLPETVEVIDGNVDYADRYVRAKEAAFPCSASGPVWTEGRPFPARTVVVWYCRDCRRAEAAWQARRDRPDDTPAPS